MKQLDIKLMHPAEQIAIIIGRIYRSGMTTTSGGNLSIMDENGDLWITPAGIDKGSLKPSDIMCVKADGTIVGPHRPSSEYPFHKAIYKMNPKARSVIHAHPPGLVTFSVVHKIPDTSIIPQARAVCGPVGFAEYALPGSELLGKKIVSEFQKNPDYKAVIMENHGVVLFGEDIADAYQRFETLELCARTILNAKTLGEPKYLSEEQINKHEMAVNTPFEHFMNVSHPSDERAIRTEICQIVRRACSQGLMCSSYGTASVRWKGNDFLITPANVQRWDIDPEDIVQVKDGMVEAGKMASRSVALHYEIYRRNPKVNSIILTQSPALMGFCTTGVKFDVRTIPESWIFLQDIPTFPFGSQYDERLSDLADEFRERPFVMLENDSVVVTGDKLINTFDRLEVADFSARSLILAAPLGDLKPITDAEIEDLRVAFHVGE
ncbi:MAG: class II aldolase/adducin family protein [Bacteroidales bacterium]|jgi:L-fuculose-phosphate aldolase|nr:class II aldolase/adducin family protein [Bacteroidales bacterium]MCR5465052.1 class II aldolase/adducin family protein [Bacteroidales bacterium]